MDSGNFPDDESMDYDDYRLLEQTSINKTIILQSTCHASKQYSVRIPYDFQNRRLDLGKVLFQIFKEIIPVGHEYQVFYYCDESQYFIFGGMYPFQDFLFINQNFVAKPIISVKIIRINPPVNTQVEKVSKKKRINDRTIREILEKVAEWRNIHINKSITLQEASKEVDLPKKTLDDYFYQIKQGEFYGFNFEMNLDERIGVLRKFVKENHKKKSEQQIKILQKFMQEPQCQQEEDVQSGQQ